MIGHFNSLGQPRGVIFDLFFTLLKEDFTGPFYRTMARDLGIDAGTFLAAFRSLSRSSMLGEISSMEERVWKTTRLCELERDRDVVREVVARNIELFYSAIEVYNDSASALIRLRKGGIATGIASNASAHSKAVLGRSGLDELVTASVLSYEVRSMKPEPAIYEHICKMIGVTPANCVFVGDGGDRELEGARALGMKTILIDRDLSHTDAARPFADLCVRSVAEAVDALL